MEKLPVIVFAFLAALLITSGGHGLSDAAQSEDNIPCMLPGTTTTECVRLLARGARIFCCDGLDDVDYICLCTANWPIPGIFSPMTLIGMGHACSVSVPEVCKNKSYNEGRIKMVGL